jgi:5-methylcytosine-specific restriction endonuclease McrA
LTQSADSELLQTLLAKAKRMYKENKISYEWGEVVKLVEADPQIFMACLRRAKRYKLPLGAPKSYKLWISCNIASGYKVRNDCYYCGKVMKREEFLTGDVHLEHFYPRDGGGEHIPININLACSSCNRLKNRYQDKDFRLLLNNPEEFREAHPKMTLRTYQNLMDFAKIIAIRLEGSIWVTDRFGATGQTPKEVCDQLRFVYRQKWGIG